VDNDIEIIGVNIGMATLCSGMIYNQADTHSLLNSILLVFIVFLNLFFILSWLYLFSNNLGSKYKIFD